MARVPQISVKEGTYTNFRPLGIIFALYGLSHALKNFLARLITFYKISIPQLVIWACNVTCTSSYIFKIFLALVIIGNQLPKCTERYVKLHRSAHKMSEKL